MRIPLVDLSAQYATIKEEIDRAISDVIATTAFVGGRFVESLKGLCGILLCYPLHIRRQRHGCPVHCPQSVGYRERGRGDHRGQHLYRDL